MLAAIGLGVVAFAAAEYERNLEFQERDRHRTVQAQTWEVQREAEMQKVLIVQAIIVVTFFAAERDVFLTRAKF